MKSLLIFLFLTALGVCLGIGLHASAANGQLPNANPEPFSCPLGWSTIAQLKAGSGLAYCTMPSCRAASAGAHGHTTKYVQNPLCNPVTGANCEQVLAWHYDYVLSGTPSGACASDVVSGPWSTTSN